MTAKPTQPITISTSVTRPTLEELISFADILKRGTKGSKPTFLNPKNMGLPTS